MNNPRPFWKVLFRCYYGCRRAPVTCMQETPRVPIQIKERHLQLTTLATALGLSLLPRSIAVIRSNPIVVATRASGAWQRFYLDLDLFNRCRRHIMWATLSGVTFYRGNWAWWWNGPPLKWFRMSHRADAVYFGITTDVGYVCMYVC